MAAVKNENVVFKYVVDPVCGREPNCFSRISPNIFSAELAGRNHPLSKNRRNLRLWNACPSANPQSSEKYMVCAATRLSLTLNSWQTKCRNYPELIFLLAELNLLWFAPSLRMFVGPITKRIQAFLRVEMTLVIFWPAQPPFLLLKITGVLIYCKLVSSRLVLFSSLTNKVKHKTDITSGLSDTGIILMLVQDLVNLPNC